MDKETINKFDIKFINCDEVNLSSSLLKRGNKNG